MNAQSTHPTDDTVDPQFLGPEAGQQAGGGGQCVSELDANGSELHRYFSVTRGAPILVRSNGVTLCRQVDDDWNVLSRNEAECSLAQWVANKKVSLSSLHRCQLEVEELPQHAGVDGVERGRYPQARTVDGWMAASMLSHCGEGCLPAITTFT